MTPSVSRAARAMAGDKPVGRLAALPSWQVSEPYLLEAPVARNTRIGDRYFRLRLHAPAIARHARPGQFVMLTAAREARREPVLPRPMALLDWDAEAGHIDIIYGVVGPGTRLLTSFTTGERIVVTGPLGRGFDLDNGSDRVLLAGRGIGACSLTALAGAAVRRGIDVIALDSARHADALVGQGIYRSAGITSVIGVIDADGSSDIGLVAERLRAILGDRPARQIFTCGSARLFGLCRQLAEDSRADLQVSLEARMACGIGYCHGCSAGRRSADAEDPLICRDGPAFRWLGSEDEH